MLGTSANGTGTSKAFEIGPVEGTIASLSMLLTAGASLVIVPLFLSWILKASVYTLAFYLCICLKSHNPPKDNVNSFISSILFRNFMY